MVWTGLLTVAPAYAQDGVKGVDEAWIRAVKAGNVDAVVALYAPDATLYPPDAQEAHGTAAIRASYTEMLGALGHQRRDHRLPISDVWRYLHRMRDSDADDDAQGRRVAADR